MIDTMQKEGIDSLNNTPEVHVWITNVASESQLRVQARPLSTTEELTIMRGCYPSVVQQST